MENKSLSALRREIIEKDFSNLNSEQFKAVTHTEGPLLILAGAGSGKTTVLINRIAYLIKYGCAYGSDRVFCASEDDCRENFERYLGGDGSVYPFIENSLRINAPKPWQILAITFTNKAADELKERLEKKLGPDGEDVFAATFHSMCVRILRREAERIGFTSHFTIYDTDDSKRLMKECQRRLEIDEKFLSAKTVLGEISKQKDKLISPETYMQQINRFDERSVRIAKAYELYQKLLRDADAMDFDDLIVNTVELFRSNPGVLEYYQNRFRYIMVDEYQDTNIAQYVLVAMLAGGYNNICVVGDDDQSIYSFRGATIANILSFEKQFGNAAVIKLEENYRSTQNILDAANAVIANNTERKGKSLWTENEKGDKLTLYTAYDDLGEAAFVARKIMDLSVEGTPFSDTAVLYRTNAQSNNLERALAGEGIPYRIIGGHRFYDRKEIRDAIAYLSVVSNPADNVRLRRIINEPKRGIGETTMNNLFEISSVTGESMFDIMGRADEYSALSRAAGKLKLFRDMILTLSKHFDEMPIADAFAALLNESGYIEGLNSDMATREDRIENLNELYNTIKRYENDNGDEATLQGYLEEVALISDIDNYDNSLDTVTLMTLHSAKGLEFPVVFLVGLENGLFPSAQSVFEPLQLQEERRLAYVGITRAQKKLFLTNARQRLQFGKTSSNPPSVFLTEIPEELINDVSPKKSYSQGFGGFGSFDGFGGFGGSGGFGGYVKSQSSGGDFFFSSDVYRKPESKPQKVYSKATDGLTVGLEEKNNAPAPDIRTGDRVRHKKFGEGLVVSSTPLGNDILLEIAFDTVGTKKLMGKIARLEKI